MELGTGIFLASLVIGFVMLYGQTKDRWNWKKIVWRGLGAPIVIGVIGVGSWLGYIQYEDSKWQILDKTDPTPIHEYDGIKLGMKEDTIIFLKGEPDYIGPENAEIKTISEYRNQYEGSVAEKYSSEITIFYDGAREVAGILCWSQREYGCAPLGGIRLGSPVNQVFKLLGKPTNLKLSDNKKSLSVDYENLNISFDFYQGKVNSLGIFTNKKGEIIPLSEKEEALYQDLLE
jgi:hypothetical protein